MFKNNGFEVADIKFLNKDTCQQFHKLTKNKTKVRGAFFIFLQQVWLWSMHK